MTIPPLSTEKTKPGIENPIWLPSIAPSGMTFVTSDKYPSGKDASRFIKISVSRIG
jgi:glucose/arabinose dehydrogenase